MSHYEHKIDDDESARIQRFLYWVAAGTAAFVVIIIIAILTAHHWLTFISPASERDFMRPFVTWANENLVSDADPVLQAYIEELGNEIAADMELPDGLELEFHVVDGGMVNAFTTLGGYVFVFEGLIEELDSENALAMVIGHEIGHAANRDPLLATGRGVLLQIMVSSLSGGGIDTTNMNRGSEFMLNIYNRDQEEAADRLAFEAVYDRYGHVGGATQLFRVLAESEEDIQTIEMLSSHPDVESRIEYLDELAKEKGWSANDVTLYPEEVRQVLSNQP